MKDIVLIVIYIIIILTGTTIADSIRKKSPVKSYLLGLVIGASLAFITSFFL